MFLIFADMNEEQRLLGCRNFTIKPVVIIVGVCRIVELVRDDGGDCYRYNYSQTDGFSIVFLQTIGGNIFRDKCMVQMEWR